ncbi:MAG: ABC transporter permease [Gammaproteobacteria bacterium]|nr:ABC transporter permease [Pseudomonadota bacterium]MCZ6733086.1 ABC transporter permease [Gammaproteobacteria bacterium]
MLDLSLPRLKRRSVNVWRRNVLVWRKLMGPSLMLNFGEPLVYLLGLGYGLGLFIGQMAGVPYLTFLASGIIASSAMTTATFEGMYSVYTRMVSQRTYDAMLATPMEVDDILAGEMLWCATKSLINGIAILAVAAILGAVADMRAVLVLPVVFLIGLCFAGPAMVMTSVSKGYDFFAYYFTLVITPMFIVCGVFYPTNVLPEFVQRFVQVLPLTHAVALTRPLIVGQPLTDVALHISVLLAYAVIGYYIAVILIRRRLLV